MDLKKIKWAINLYLRLPAFKKIGRKSYLGPSISLIGIRNVTIGDCVRIYPGNRIETHNSGSIIISDGCSIGQNFHITSGKTNLIIGKNTTISGNVFITNIDHEYRQMDKHTLEQPMIYNETVIGENCFIGYGVAIQAGTKLGKHCVVGSNAVVRGEFPDYSVIVGVPGRVIKRYDKLKEGWCKVGN